MQNGRVTIRVKRVGFIGIPDPVHTAFVWQSGNRVTVTLDGEPWRFVAAAFTIGRTTDDGPFSDSTLKLPLRAVYENMTMRFALDAAGIVWLSHYSSGSPATDDDALVRPGHRDAIMTTLELAPDFFPVAFPNIRETEG